MADNGNLRLLDTWTRESHPGITLEGFTAFRGQTMCDYFGWSELATIAKVESGTQRAIFIAGNAKPTSLNFRHITDWLVAAGTSGPVGTYGTLEHQTTAIPEQSVNGAIVGSLPSASGNSYVLTSGNQNLFSFNATTGDVTIANAALLKAGARQELRFNKVTAGSVIGETVITVIVNNSTSGTIELKGSALNLQVAASALPLFSWDAVPGAVSYELMVDGTSPAQAGLLNLTGLSGTTFQTTIPMKAGTYTGKVRARFANNSTSAWSPDRSFDIVLTTDFLTPLPQITDSNQTISWTAVTGVPAWHVIVNNVPGGTTVLDSPTFAGTVFSPPTSIDTGLAVVALADGTYRAQVQAVNGAIPLSSWTTSWDFTFDFTPEVTTLVANGVINSTDAFVWQAIAGADRYELEVVTNDAAKTVVLRRTDVTTTSFIPSPTLTGGSYLVRVRSIDDTAGGPVGSRWSQHVAFQVNVAPVLSTSPTNLEVDEAPGNSLTTEVLVGTINIADDGLGSVTLTVGGLHASYFRVQPVVGQPAWELFLRSGLSLNREAPDLLTSLQIDINADDSAGPQNPDTVLPLTINVKDLNDNTPTVLSAQTVSVPESAALNAAFNQVNGTDTDVGGSWSYVWSMTDIVGLNGTSYPGLFSLINVQPGSGSALLKAQVRVNQANAFDFENAAIPKEFTLKNVRVSDGTNLSTPVDVKVLITNDNDELPAIPGGQIIVVPERKPDGTVHDVGTQFGPIAGLDADLSEGNYTWEVVTTIGNDTLGANNPAKSFPDAALNLPDLFTLVPSLAANGHPQAHISLLNPAYLDFDRLFAGAGGDIPNEFTVTIRLRDGNSGHAAAEQSVLVRLTGINDEVPVVTAGQTFTVPENSPFGTVVSPGPAGATDLDVPTTFQSWQMVVRDAEGSKCWPPTDEGGRRLSTR